MANQVVVCDYDYLVGLEKIVNRLIAYPTKTEMDKLVEDTKSFLNDFKADKDSPQKDLWSED